MLEAEYRLAKQYFSDIQSIDLTKLTIDKYRQSLDPLDNYCFPDQDVSIKQKAITARDWIKVKTYFINMDSPSDSVLFFFPGNSFITRLFKPNFNYACHIAKQANIKCVYVDFRLCPENTISKCFDDCYDVVKELYQKDEYQLTGHKFILSGISSGARISASISATVAKTKDFNIDQLILLNGSYNFDFKGKEYEEFEKKDPILSKPAANLAKSFMNIDLQLDDPYISPSFIKLDSNFPNTYILVAEYDGVRGQSEGFYQKLNENNNPVTKILLKNQSHNTQFFRGVYQMSNASDKVFVDILKGKYQLRRSYTI